MPDMTVKDKLKGEGYEIQAKFLEWLENKGLMAEFVSEFVKYKKGDGIRIRDEVGNDLYNYLKKCSEDKFLYNAFFWSNTDKGFDFWEELNYEWLNILKNENVTINKEDKTNPKHYKSKQPEPIEVILSWGLDFLEGNVIKYLARYKDKNGVEDLLKARTYLDLLIEREENNG